MAAYMTKIGLVSPVFASCLRNNGKNGKLCTHKMLRYFKFIDLRVNANQSIGRSMFGSMLSKYD